MKYLYKDKYEIYIYTRISVKYIYKYKYEIYIQV